MFEVIELGGMKTTTVKESCNHVYMIDVSGSMYNSLPLMRTHLKNIISLIAKPEDTFSLIYFSGRGQCGVVFENVEVSDVGTVTALHSAIDRYIQPTGLTGFAEPMTLAIDMAGRLKNKINNFVMLTDGYDNCSKVSDIVEKSKQLGQTYDLCTFIEYGWYCNRNLISEMTEKSGGIHIFAETYEQYETVFNKAISQTVQTPKIEVSVNKKAKDCVYILNNEIVIAPVTDGVVSVPEEVTKVHSIVPSDVLSKQLSDEHVYLILFYAAKTNQNKLVWDCLERLGDVHLIKQYINAFTKQELSVFEDSVKQAVLDIDSRYVEGKDVSFVPDKNAVTVVDVLEKLASTNAQLIINNPDFLKNYKRTTKASVVEDKENKPKFIPSAHAKVYLNNLVYNSERPNISIHCVIDGTVRLPASEFFDEGTRIKSHQHRNYTIVRDGIINTPMLPLFVSSECHEWLTQNIIKFELIEETDDGAYIELFLTSVPVINRSMTTDISITEFGSIQSELLNAKAEQKVINSLIKEQTDGVSDKIEGLVDKYGKEAAEYLSSIGIRDYGFSPVGTTTVESTDFYEALEVSVKMKGFSSLPAINKVREKAESGKKLTPSEQLINHHLEYYSTFELNELIDAKSDMTGLVRHLLAKQARMVYSIILSRHWFKDEDQPSVSTVVIDSTKQEVQMTVDVVRKEIKI